MISSKSPVQAALVAARNAATQQTQMTASVERLSSGLKINRAKDSVSGFGIAVNLIQSNTAYDITDKFLSLETRIDDLITVINAKRSLLGAFQNQTDVAISNLNHQLLGLSDAKSQIQDTDFAWETARLTRLQIGQQAATAMLAQANAIPNVILALIE